MWEDEGGRVVGPAELERRPRFPAPSGGEAAGSRGGPPSSESPGTPGGAGYGAPMLPSGAIDQFTVPLGRFLRTQATSGVVLAVATVVALILSNSSWSEPFLGFWEVPIGLRVGSFEFGRSVQLWLNDGLMTLFFFVVALELKRELLLGELRSWRSAALPFAGAVGGMIVPTGIFLALTANTPARAAWGSVVATDTAVVLGALAVLGSRVPTILRLFLLSLAIFDDVGAILILTIGYGDGLGLRALGLACVALGSVFAAERAGIRSVPVYSLLGASVWLTLDASGIHPTIAGVALGFMTPARGWVSDGGLRAMFERVLAHPRGEHQSGDTPHRAHLEQAGRAAGEFVSPLERLEAALHPWVGVGIMPVFALANAGVAISWTGTHDPVTGAILASMVVGKPAGVSASVWLAVRSGLATRPASLTWPLLVAGALLTGSGFTMSLLIAELAYPPGLLLDAAKLGILGGAAVSATAGMIVLRWVTRGSWSGRPTGVPARDQSSGSTNSMKST